ncbi:uncharacterized protein EV420DRAFT_1472761 [Desarmillaria tabescens]|uniref:Uncharacterized protein n=1 Tax=Armillaria tabescens TaxID=1929756 RepID=A0AA39NQ93_ARMTA|nr:uncharacterized protein EV420DRAFT_1472761 [Desarmillaria tabescens]KAK0469553.1 hypothetical protein EV420DRAFT_1472761 [Desarmillaria tabescens]
MSVPDPTNMAAFLDFFKSDMMDNPPAPRSFLRIPQELTPEWKIFFEKLAVFCENSCGSVNDIPYNTYERIAWEKRQWIMEDENLDEFDMWLTATLTRKRRRVQLPFHRQGNEALRNGESEKAFGLYMISVRIFPCPDAMNNLAACALKENSKFRSTSNRFSIAEQHTTIGYLTTPVGRAKAHYAEQRHVVIWEISEKGLKQPYSDVNLALELQPNDTAILALKDELTRLSDIVVSAASLQSYLDQQPHPPAKISWSEGLDKRGYLLEGCQYDKLPLNSPLRRAPPPMY